MRSRLDVPWFMEGANDSGVLRSGGHIFYEFKAGSIGICSILRKFESQGWPESIDNPNGTGASAVNTARDFVRKTKRRQKRWPRIEFKTEDSGAVITWRLLEQPELPEQGHFSGDEESDSLLV